MSIHLSRWLVNSRTETTRGFSTLQRQLSTYCGVETEVWCTVRFHCPLETAPYKGTLPLLENPTPSTQCRKRLSRNLSTQINISSPDDEPLKNTQLLSVIWAVIKENYSSRLKVIIALLVTFFP